MPAVKKPVAKPAAAKPAAAKKPAAKKGGALEIAPIAATGLLLAAQKMYKDMMAEEAKRPASSAGKRTRKTRRGGAPDDDIGPSHPLTDIPDEERAPEVPSEEVAEPVAPAAPAAAPSSESAAKTNTLSTAVETVLQNTDFSDDELATIQAALDSKKGLQAESPAQEELPAQFVESAAQDQPQASASPTEQEMVGGAKKARKSSAKPRTKRGGGEVAPVAAIAGGSELSMPAPLAGGAKKARKPSAKRGGGEILSMPAPLAGGSELTMPAPLAGGAKKATKRGGSGALAPTAAVAGGMPLAPANTAPLYPESTSPMAGGAKKAAKKPTKRMAGGELAAYTAQLSKLTSQLRTLM